jgi:hypothetical protein
VTHRLAEEIEGLHTNNFGSFVFCVCVLPGGTFSIKLYTGLLLLSLLCYPEFINSKTFTFRVWVSLSGAQEKAWVARLHPLYPKHREADRKMEVCE